MKILTASQIKEADQFTIQDKPIASIDLMERASKAFVAHFSKIYGSKQLVVVFCGMGNNGGDGLAIARMLLKKKYTVLAYVIKDKENGSPDFETNLRRFQNLCPLIVISKKSDIPGMPKDAVVIDAIFGSGLARPVAGLHGEVIQALNASNTPIVAVDIASGLFSDKPSEGNNIVKPRYTISFQVYKLAFLMPENADFVGDLAVVDIGLNKDFIERIASPYEVISRESVTALLRPRRKYAHKGDFGKVMLVAGSWGKMGAAVLSAKACLRTGAGLLSIHAPRCGYEILQSSVPEAMVEPDVRKKYITLIKDTDRFDTLGIGPGIGTSFDTKYAVTALLKHYNKPVVLDADALNILGANKMLLKNIPPESILTPHPKEFERLAGKFGNSFDRLQLQAAFSKKYKCITVVKGAHTSVCSPEGKVFFNSTGNPGMATGGSGDVLTGMITALLGQKYAPLDAAIVGVFLHGLAGDIAAERFGQEAMLPSDIVDHIASAYLSFR